MEKCKFCQEELAENGTFCPHCGRDNAAAEETAVTEPAVNEAAESAEEVAVAEEIAPVEAAAEEVSTEEAAPAEVKKATPGKIALAVVAVLALLAVLIALIVGGLGGSTAAPGETEAAVETEETVPATVPADGNPDDVTCKGTYTVTDEEAVAAMDKVVAKIGDHELTNGQLQVYYWSIVNSYLSSEYGYYMMNYYGALDYTKPLDTQISYENSSQTWQQYFLQEALDYWQLNQALSIEAENAGLEMAQEEKDYIANLPASLEETAAYYGLQSVEELLLYNVGPGADLEDFTYFQELYYKGMPYYNSAIAGLTPTAEEVEAYFASNEETYASGGITKDGVYVDVRHILVMPQGGTTDDSGVTTYSDEEWETCRVKAQEILDQWLAGEATEDSFAALANEKSEDGGSNTNGGLYENVYVGQMVEPFETWCFDETRAAGDYGLVKTDYGYHVMYFCGSTPIWQVQAESDWIIEQQNAALAKLADDYPLEVDYSAIELGFIDLASN